MNVRVDEELALRRIRLLIRRVGQDCGAEHPEIAELAELVDTYERLHERRLLVELARSLGCASPDCFAASHCELLRRDLVSEVNELLSSGRGAVAEDERHVESRHL